MHEEKRDNAPDWLYTAAGIARYPMAVTFFGALAFLYLRSFMLPFTPLIAHDDRVVFFARALRMVHGQVPYRDFFELVTPGMDLLYEATLRMLGVHAWILQAWSIAVGVVACLMITRIASAIFRGWMVLLPALLFLVFAFESAPDPTHHWFSTLFALGAAAVLLGRRANRGLGRIVAAGLLCGVATLFTQTQGGLAFAGMAVYLVWRRREEKDEFADPGIAVQLAALVLPCLAIVGCVLGYYIHLAGWHTLWFDLLEFPVKYLPSGNPNSSSSQDYLRQFPTVHGLADILHLVPYLLVYAAVPYAYLFGIYRVWRSRERWSDSQPLPSARLLSSQRQAVMLLSLVGLGLCLAVAHGPRFHRLCTVSPPAMLVGVWLMSGASAIARRSRQALWVLGIGYLILLPVARQAKRLPTLELPTGRVAFTDPLDYRETQWLAARTQPGDLFFNNSDMGLYLALVNPTQSEWVTDTDFSPPEEVRSAVAAMRARSPQFIVLASESAKPGMARSHNNSGPFRQFVQENYRLAETFPLEHNTRQEEMWELRPPSMVGH